MNRCLELARFRLLPSANVDGFLARMESLDAWLARRPGFRSRRLALDGEGWLDIVEWESATQAHEAMAASQEDPTLLQAFADLDMSSFECRHVELLHAVP